MWQHKQFTTNLQSSLVSFTTYEQREYMVVPCVALVPGVLNGDLVTLDAVAGSYKPWNGRPLVLDHPQVNGAAVSANDPVILEDVGIGHVWYTDIDDNKLRVQAWLDTAKATRIGGDARKVVDMIKAGSPVEVSTGYWASMRAHKGVFNNVEYEHITETIIPDHLAILPNALGACSWADGCGIPRINERKPMDDEKTVLTTLMNAIKKMITPNMTVSDQFQALNALIAKEMEAEGFDLYSWHLMDIEDNYAIVGVKGSIKRRAFITGDDGNIAFSGEWEEVQMQTTFAPVVNSAICEACQATNQAETDEPEEPDEPDEEPEDVPGEEDDDKPPTEDEDNMAEVTTQQQADTLKVFLEQLDVNEEDVKVAVQARQNQRKAWADTIKANSQLTDDDIKTMSDNALEKMAVAVTPIAGIAVDQAMDYSGRGLPGQDVQVAHAHPVKRQSALLKSVS
jgi:hypothetical protein